MGHRNPFVPELDPMQIRPWLRAKVLLGAQTPKIRHGTAGLADPGY